jgi:hypothetical protein
LFRHGAGYIAEKGKGATFGLQSSLPALSPPSTSFRVGALRARMPGMKPARTPTVRLDL